MRISEFNNIVSQDIINTKNKVFKIVESVTGFVPISLSEQLLFCHCENKNVNYYTADYKINDDTVVCENIKKIDIDFNETRSKLSNIVEQFVDKKVNNVSLDDLKITLIESVKKYIINDNYKKFEFTPKIAESIKRKSKNKQLNKMSRKVAVKIREAISHLNKDHNIKAGSKNVKKALESGSFVFQPLKVDVKSKVFESTMVWNIKRIKKLAETKDYAEKLKSIYDSYISESSDFDIRVNEMATKQGIELLTINELANMFNKSSIILGYKIDDECGGNMINKVHEGIVSYKSYLIKQAVKEIMPDVDENTDMNTIIEGIRRHIYLNESDMNNLSGASEVENPDNKIPDAKIDKSIAKDTGEEIDSQVYDYTSEDVAIILDTLKEILRNEDEEKYNEMFSESEEDIEKDITKDEQVMEDIKSTAQLILEDMGVFDDEDVVAISKNDIEDEDLLNIDDSEELDSEGEASISDIVVGYINDLDLMTDNDTVDVEQFENIIEFIINYYESAEVVDDDQDKTDTSDENADEVNKIENDADDAEEKVEDAIMKKGQEMPVLSRHKKSII